MWRKDALGGAEETRRGEERPGEMSASSLIRKKEALKTRKKNKRLFRNGRNGAIKRKKTTEEKPFFSLPPQHWS